MKANLKKRMANIDQKTKYLDLDLARLDLGPISRSM